MARPSFVNFTSIRQYDPNGASSGTLTVPFPSSYSSGDLAILSVYTNYSSAAGSVIFFETTPSGSWTELISTDSSASGSAFKSMQYQCWWKIAESTAESSPVLQYSSDLDAESRVHGTMYLITGVDQTTPILQTKWTVQTETTGGVSQSTRTSSGVGSSNSGFVIVNRGHLHNHSFDTVGGGGEWTEHADGRTFTAVGANCGFHEFDSEITDATTNLFVPDAQADANVDIGNVENIFVTLLVQPPQPVGGTTHEGEADSTAFTMETSADAFRTAHAQSTVGTWTVNTTADILRTVFPGSTVSTFTVEMEGAAARQVRLTSTEPTFTIEMAGQAARGVFGESTAATWTVESSGALQQGFALDSTAATWTVETSAAMVQGFALDSTAATWTVETTADITKGLFPDSTAATWTVETAGDIRREIRLTSTSAEFTIEAVAEAFRTVYPESSNGTVSFEMVGDPKRGVFAESTAATFTVETSGTAPTDSVELESTTATFSVEMEGQAYRGVFAESSAATFAIEAAGEITHGIGLSATAATFTVEAAADAKMTLRPESSAASFTVETTAEPKRTAHPESSAATFTVETAGDPDVSIRGGATFALEMSGDPAVAARAEGAAEVVFNASLVTGVTFDHEAEASITAFAVSAVGAPTVELSFFGSESISMATNRLNLYNIACRSMGERPLASLNVTEEARFLLDEVYSSGKGVIKYFLEQAFWDWAKRAQFVEADTSVTSLFGYDYAYELPDDWVRLYALATDENYNHAINEYVINNGFLLCNHDEIYWTYISCDTDYGADFSKWPETFTLWAGTWMATQVAPRLKSYTDLERLSEKERMYRENAITKNATESATLFPPSGSWNRARTSGTGRGDRGKRSQLTG